MLQQVNLFLTGLLVQVLAVLLPAQFLLMCLGRQWMQYLGPTFYVGNQDGVPVSWHESSPQGAVAAA